MHLPIRGNELSDLSATSGTIFLASKLQEIVIRRHQKICDIAVDLSYGKGGWCPLQSRANNNRLEAVVGAIRAQRICPQQPLTNALRKNRL